LGEFDDISEYVLAGLGTTESDNEAEDSKIVDARKSETKQGKQPGTTKSIRLQELGPRMKLQLIKVEEGMCTGRVHYHKHYVKTEAELKQLRVKINARKQSEAFRKKKMEERALKSEKQKSAAISGKKSAATSKNKSETTEEKKVEDEYDNEDIEWYRSEVGEEPDDEVKESLKKKVTDKDHRLPKKYRKRKREASDKPEKKEPKGYKGQTKKRKIQNSKSTK